MGVCRVQDTHRRIRKTFLGYLISESGDGERAALDRLSLKVTVHFWTQKFRMLQNDLYFDLTSTQANPSSRGKNPDRIPLDWPAS